MSQSLRCVSSLSPPLHASRRLEAVERPQHAGSGGATPARWKRWSDANTWGGKQSLLSCAWRKELKAGYLTLFFPILRSLRCSSTRMKAVERPQHVGKAVFQRVALPPGRWKRWSDPNTWGKQSLLPWDKKPKGWPFRLGVPGRGLLQWRDVTIPCGAAILLDVPEVRVGRLKIKGWLNAPLLSSPSLPSSSPCGAAILLDVPEVRVGRLKIKGLKNAGSLTRPSCPTSAVLDSPKLPHIRVRARFILVMGRFTAGSAARQLSSHLTVTLHPNTGFSGGRKPYKLRKVPPADARNPRDLGHKAFAVVGGQVDLHGMPGGADTPSWVRLAATAAAGQRQLIVEGDVRGWRPGLSIAVASTSTNFNEAESREIGSGTAAAGQRQLTVEGDQGVFENSQKVSSATSLATPCTITAATAPPLPPIPSSISPTPSHNTRPGLSSHLPRITLTSPLAHTHEGTSVPDGFGGMVDILALVSPATSPPTSRITLTSPLAHTHEGTPVPDGFGGMVDIRAEVALLDRQIVIQGTDELPPHQYDGSHTHFMVYMTGTPQAIEGGQFRGLGNQSTLGRYPLHFHVCGHFMVYMTRTPQAIEGVQFRGLGNQGTLGRYPLHFHVCGLPAENNFLSPRCLPSPPPGGHFMVYMTRTPQTIEGVQFRGLGNQGMLGRYPLHFHVCGLPADASQPHIVRKNAIVHSKQRCMVIHATSNMNIEDNITYETKGHCYLVEEGSEMGNVFRRNLGMSVRKVEKEIPPDTSDQYGFHTDKQPSVFWMATPYNSFYGNVAAGSENSGHLKHLTHDSPGHDGPLLAGGQPHHAGHLPTLIFWLEANPTMRGISRLLPAIGNKRPDRWARGRGGCEFCPGVGECGYVSMVCGGAHPTMRGISRLLPAIGNAFGSLTLVYPFSCCLTHIPPYHIAPAFSHPFSHHRACICRFNWGDYVGNVAHSSLFGFHMYPHGSQSRFPGSFNWGEYVGNVAHSSLFGFRTYPHGSQSRFPDYTGVITYLKDALFYRNKAGVVENGAFVENTISILRSPVLPCPLFLSSFILFVNTDRIVVENGAFVENAYGMDISRNVRKLGLQLQSPSWDCSSSKSVWCSVWADGAVCGRRSVWACGAVHGRAVQCMGVRCSAWACGAVHGRVVQCMGVRCSAWACGAVHGRAVQCMGVRCSAWGRAVQCMGVRCSAWACGAVHGRAVQCMGVRCSAWACGAVHGRAVQCMGVRCSAWACGAVHGCAVQCMGVRCSAWVCGAVHGRAVQYMGVRCSAWACGAVHGCAVQCMGVRCSPWACGAVHGCAVQCMGVRAVQCMGVRCSAWVCGAVHGCAVQCMGVRCSAWVCGAVHGCAVQCMGVRCSTWACGAVHGQWEPPGMADAIKPWAEFLYPFPSDDGGDYGEDGGDYDDYGDYGGGASGDTIAAAAAAPSGTGRQNGDTGRSLQAAQAAAAVVVPQKEIGDGSFESPIGVTLSQSNPADILRPSSVEHSL
ncbi:unnamed protein product [Closterium sp. NIES-64]|nr:unnamed protein product [Closterium sp. NIES-64]